jgi:hypothetical protein
MVIAPAASPKTFLFDSGRKAAGAPGSSGEPVVPATAPQRLHRMKHPWIRRRDVGIAAGMI